MGRLTSSITEHTDGLLDQMKNQARNASDLVVQLSNQMSAMKHELHLLSVAIAKDLEKNANVGDVNPSLELPI
jgi:hypothetical protein